MENIIVLAVSHLAPLDTLLNSKTYWEKVGSGLYKLSDEGSRLRFCRHKCCVFKAVSFVEGSCYFLPLGGTSMPLISCSCAVISAHSRNAIRTIRLFSKRRMNSVFPVHLAMRAIESDSRERGSDARLAEFPRGRSPIDPR